MLASEVQAVGGLHVPFPASSKNPIAMALNVRRLARVLASERVDLVHARSRAAAWVALGACRKLKRAAGHGCSPAKGRPAGRARASKRRRGRATSSSPPRNSPPTARRRSFPPRSPRLRIVRPGLDFAQARAEARSAASGWRRRARTGASSRTNGWCSRRPVLRRRAGKGWSSRPRPCCGRGAFRTSASCSRATAAKPSFARELDALAARARRQGHRHASRARLPIRRRPSSARASRCLPAREPEGVGRTAIEAAAMGALTIVADVGPAREIVLAPPQAPPEERTGWIVPPGDAAALAAAIEAGADARRVGAGGDPPAVARAVVELYSLERMRRDMLNVYAEALRAAEPDGFQRLQRAPDARCIGSCSCWSRSSSSPATT